MSAQVFVSETGERYVDRKRYAWVLSLLIPATVVVGPLLYLQTGVELALWTPLFFYYTIIPLLDRLLGEDRSNPPESVVPLLEADHYYRYCTYALVPILWGSFLFSAWFVGTQNLPWHGVVAVALLCGQICGFGLNLGHELGHKKSKGEQWLARMVLSLGAYGHFYIEHNKGHHKAVATPEDCASSRMGENIYRFALRELPGAFLRAWRLEAERLRSRNLAVWSRHNEILQPLALSVVLYASLVLIFGWIMLPFLAITIFWGAFQLTSANYIEHYGLLRQRLPDGRYERCQPHHSWNSNHVFSNWALFHLQRHSDHHANPTRRFQSLRHFDKLPELPSGYTGMYLLAWIPPVWFHFMNPRLLQAVNADPGKINFLPSRREQLIRRYRLATETMG
ncbi:alkane 1-monooxygenase [Allohahella sp. A8]|uniref:alkane 1-monooxygenase n=1 Tax=Allohahella sp. A8 TaxID=3141461 RepID=UPI000C0B980C|nr:alkane 1-monooxygenase [Hahellaceae bacterium]|tara:strand:+ start:71316 stop:72497 length:1182 start_codon:yes stop_codon:yes gene_type:complete